MNWGNFFMAEVGAAAGLTGLIFVAVSINLKRILEHKHLPDRALQSLILLFNILIISSVMLIPNQPLAAAGIEVLVFSLIFWTVIFKLSLQILSNTPAEHNKRGRMHFALTQAAALPFAAGGLCMLVFGAAGIYFLVAGIFLSFYKAISDSWILLVEINR